jgi:hypothetical protein
MLLLTHILYILIHHRFLSFCTPWFQFPMAGTYLFLMVSIVFAFGADHTSIITIALLQSNAATAVYHKQNTTSNNSTVSYVSVVVITLHLLKHCLAMAICLGHCSLAMDVNAELFPINGCLCWLLSDDMPHCLLHRLLIPSSSLTRCQMVQVDQHYLCSRAPLNSVHYVNHLGQAYNVMGGCLISREDG